GGSTYHTVLRQLAQASSGRFAPEELTDELDDEEDIARVSFRHGGKFYSCEVPWEDDCFQRPVLDLVNKAMKAGKAREQFISLPPRGQTVSLVLATPALYRRGARGRGVSWGGLFWGGAAAFTPPFLALAPAPPPP